jgi:ribonucleoside-diphosphate reductase alpha chain
MMEVIRLHRAAVEDIAPNKDFSYLKDEARSAWQNVIALGEKHGFRNAQTTVLAPTGTISFMMDCDTTGVEPDIALVKYKLLVGGGMLKMANRTVSEALSRLGYQKDLIAKITAHIEKYDTVEDVQDDSGEIVTSGLNLNIWPFSIVHSDPEWKAQHFTYGPFANDGGCTALHQWGDF